MRIIKGVILALAGLFILLTLVSQLMPSKVITVRSVIIHADTKRIFDEIGDLQNWKHWHPVFMQDSMHVNVSMPSSGEHAFVAWNSNNRENKLLITASMPNSIKAVLSREGEQEAENIISVKDIGGSRSAEVEWMVQTKLKWYPWEKFAGIFIDKLTGPGYEEALGRLKDFVEKQTGSR